METAVASTIANPIAGWTVASRLPASPSAQCAAWTSP